MANTDTADVMPVGVAYEEPERGSYIKNCYNLPPDLWQIREGFGRVYAHNTSYNLISFNSEVTPRNCGYVKQLGSCSFITSFGHKQILSLFIASISSDVRDGSDGENSYIYRNNDIVSQIVTENTYQYVVAIYDITTNRHYEQIIGGKTSEIEDIIPMEAQYGFYDRDFIQQTNTKVFPINPETDDPFYWAELNSPTLGDVIYFGTQQLGLYAYRPVIFDAPPDVQVETTLMGAYHYTMGGVAGRNGWSESGFIEKCAAGEGLLVGGFTYLNQSEFPVPTDITAINNRLAMAFGRSIFFSDTFNGSAIIADNILSVPTDNQITAISEINGVLLIFTATETFMYQPSVGTEIQTSGRMIKINSNWGCLNSQAKIKVENRLYFCDDTGIYITDGTKIEDIAEPIRPLFRRFIEEPLTYYNRTNEENGYSLLSLPQPKIYYDWKALKGLHFSKNPLNGLVFCILPEQKMAWVIDTKNMFSIWSWNTTLTENIFPTTDYRFEQFSQLQDDFRLVDNGDDLFIVNLEPREMLLGPFPIDDPEVASKVIKSNNIYKWKVARGVDFSISYHEDRKVYDKCLKILYNPPLNVERVYMAMLGKPIEVYDGITTDAGNVLGFSNSPIPNTPIYLVPFSMSIVRTSGTVAPIGSFRFRFLFDNNQWEIPTRVNGAEANYGDIIFHPNRLDSADNFGWTAPVAGTNNIQVVGNQITIEYDGSVNPTYFGNYLNILSQQQVLFWIPMRQKIGVPSNSSTLGVGWGNTINIVNGIPDEAVILVTEFGGAGRDTDYNDNTEDRFGSQPIEWIMQTSPVRGEKGEIIKARGGFLQVFSNGPFPNIATPSTLPQYINDRGLINAMVTSDYNNYQGQIVDWRLEAPAIQDGYISDTDNVGLPVNREGLVNIIDVSQGEFTNSANQNQPKVFGNTGAVYANMNFVPPQPLGGTILIDGEDVYNTSFSTSTKGQSFYLTLYGYAQNYATKLFITSFSAAFRVMSDARRRWKSDRGAQ